MSYGTIFILALIAAFPAGYYAHAAFNRWIDTYDTRP